MEKVNWGIIGCGDVTEVKSGPPLQQIDRSNLMAVMRRTASSAEDYANRHRVPKWYTSVKKIIHDPDVNALYVATPPESHAEYTIQALKAGKPVYVEKPMAMNFEECQKMVDVAERYKTPLFVAYYRRALPGFLKVKELVDQGAIGNVRFVSIELFQKPSDDDVEFNTNWRVIPELSGGGYFMDLAAHQLDFLDFVFGPILKVKGLAGNQAALYEAEDIVSGSFLFEDGVIGTGTWCYTVSEYDEKDEIRIVGDKGQISFSTFSFEPIKLTNKEGEQTFEFAKPKHVAYNLIQTIVNELLGKGRCPSTGISGARTNWVMDNFLKEYYKSKEVVTKVSR
jgi:predicted dehydrogenase